MIKTYSEAQFSFLEATDFFETPANGMITLKIKVLRYGVHAITAFNFSNHISESGGTVEILGGEQRGQVQIATNLYDYKNGPIKVRKNNQRNKKYNNQYCLWLTPP